MMDRMYIGITFLAILSALIAIGLIAIYSASYVYAFECGLPPTYYLNKQMIGILLALILCFGIAIAPPSIVHSAAPYIFLVTLILSISTYIPGISQTIHGARRWLTIGSFMVQPGEFLKIATIWYLSYFLNKKMYTMYDVYHTLLPAMTIITLAVVALIMQPDFGQAITLGCTCFLMLYIFDVPYKHLASVGGISICIITLLVLRTPYRFNRIINFLYPWNDPQGGGFQIIQSLIAIGSGAWTGQGIACSQQKYFYLPMPHTDFIFSIIAEETGLIGTLTLVGIFGALLYSGYLFAMQFTSRYTQSLILGYTILITTQALANMSVALGIVPTKGLGLPFISYGNSAMLANGVILGILINQWKKEGCIGG